ncbi:MAG: DHH family phosphoesterase [Lachnospiraceae bacterium]|nr:DHH family phosphoesterase [Lachnospiraceae bacterium]
MRLSELSETFSTITIQCHDNPDADAIASAFGLFCFFQEQGVKTEIIYGGNYQIHKPNLKLMLHKLGIPIRYKADEGSHIRGLLITVDCQYGSGNVTIFQPDAIGMIDHHQPELEEEDDSNQLLAPVRFREIYPGLGSCATLVWSLLKDEKYPVDQNKYLSTALFCGLYADTSQFTELFNPLDLDMRDELLIDRSFFGQFRNSNLTLQELQIAGAALQKYHFQEEYAFATICSEPCDPNVLGMISDFLLQVDGVGTCVVYNQMFDGYKFSVRSCSKEVKASELAQYLSEEIGTGGGHFEKAGGFINLKHFKEKYTREMIEEYFNSRIRSYFESFDIIYPREFQIDRADMKLFVRKKIMTGFVRLSDILPLGTPITIRTIDGDTTLNVLEGIYILIGYKGDIRVLNEWEFKREYVEVEGRYSLETEYIPTVKNRLNGKSENLIKHAFRCISSGRHQIYARELEKSVKVFPKTDDAKYTKGNPGDYIAVNKEDEKDIFVIEKDMFTVLYEELHERTAEIGSFLFQKQKQDVAY